MRVWRWLLVLLAAPAVFALAVATTSVGGGIVTGLVGVRTPMIVLGVALVAGAVAVWKAGEVILN